MEIFKNTIYFLFSISFMALSTSSWAMSDEDGLTFDFKRSPYSVQSWSNRGHVQLPSFPCISESDLLAFNTVQITTDKVSKKKHPEWVTTQIYSSGYYGNGNEFYQLFDH